MQQVCSFLQNHREGGIYISVFSCCANVYVTKRITRSKNIVWNKIPIDLKLVKLIFRLYFPKENISFTSIRSIGVLFQTMFSLLVILFIIKLYARNDTFQMYMYFWALSFRLTLFWMGKVGQKTPPPPRPTSFTPAHSANVGINPKNFLSSSFNLFATLA